MSTPSASDEFGGYGASERTPAFPLPEVPPGDGVKPLPYQWPGGTAWVAVFCAVAALLTLGGYIRTHTMVQNNARRTAEELEKQHIEHGLAIERLNARLRQAEDRVALLESSGRLAGDRPGATGGLQAAVAEFFASEDQPDSLPPLPPRAQPLPMGGDKAGDGAGGAAEIVALDLGLKRVFLDRGRQDGLAVGRQLPVYRGDAWIGDVRITVVYDTTSAGQIESSNREFMVGDTVRMPETSTSGNR